MKTVSQFHTHRSLLALQTNEDCLSVAHTGLREQREIETQIIAVMDDDVTLLVMESHTYLDHSHVIGTITDRQGYGFLGHFDQLHYLCFL